MTHRPSRAHVHLDELADKIGHAGVVQRVADLDVEGADDFTSMSISFWRMMMLLSIVLDVPHRPSQHKTIPIPES